MTWTRVPDSIHHLQSRVSCAEVTVNWNLSRATFERMAPRLLVFGNLSTAVARKRRKIFGSSACRNHPGFPHRSARSEQQCLPESQNPLRFCGLFVVLPVRIELTTSPLPRGCAISSIYFTRRSFLPLCKMLGADLVLHAASPALIDSASCETLTWA